MAVALTGLCAFAGLAGFHSVAEAKDIKTNEVAVEGAPSWLTEARVDKVVFRIQQKLEWSIRRIKVRWYTQAADFAKAHSLGPFAIAVTTIQGEKIEMHLGPQVTDDVFEETFGHELVHVIVAQKYKTSIPKWLEEGLANHVARHQKVDYIWLARQAPVKDVHDLAHPLRGDADGIRYRYRASQALAEMLDKKCDLENLVRLSVQRNLADYIVTFCEIPDLNIAFNAWVKKQATNR